MIIPIDCGREIIEVVSPSSPISEEMENWKNAQNREEVDKWLTKIL